MTQAINAVSWTSSVGYALIGLAALAALVRHRTAQQAWLALAIGLLGAISIEGRVQQLTSTRSVLLGHIVLVAFLASGYAFALFRDSVLPGRAELRWALFALFVGVSAVSFSTNLPTGLSPGPTTAQWVLVWALLLLWCGCVAEPGIRFALASRGRPLVQRTRLRALSAGYGAIVVLLLFSLGLGIIAGPSLLISQRYQLTVGLIGVAIIPTLYVGFAPPRWLRRIWRDREEAALRRATGELLLATDPAPLAERSLDWAMRLVGAEAGLLVGPGREVLARRGVDDALAVELLALEPGTGARLEGIAAAAGARVLVAPLPLSGEQGMIAVLPGPFTPLFGADEVVRLGEYGVSVAMALERTRLVEALARQTERHQSILGAMSDLGEGYVTTRDGRVVHTNDAYAKLTGYTLEELTVMPSAVVVPTHGGDGDHFEATIETRDGRSVEVEVATKRLSGDGDAQWIAICRDISERHRDQRELVRRAAELQRSNAALEEFAYIASHDLQEPLRMVASYLELLERRHGAHLDTEAVEFLGYAVDGARRMQALINDLLIYSRAGAVAEEPEPTDCNTVMERVLANLQAAIESAQARVLVETLPTVPGSTTELTQVFQNLIGNAIKFHGERPPEVAVGAHAEDGQWVFSVRDNGIGIEPRHAERIFLVFKRLHAPRQYPGTGIGLAICRRVVERRGGRIWVEPAEGGGSVFRFTLPDAAAVTAQPEPVLALSG